MKSNRAGKFIRTKRGRIRYDRKLSIHYLQLLNAPSGYETQDITIGIDPGSSFDGFSVVSSDTHHINIELIQRPKRGKTTIKSFKQRQATNRRTRRSRLRHRPIRFDNRTSNRIIPTIRANVEFRKWLITRLCAIYPITRVVIEDVKFNHFKNTNGRAFSLVEQGKNELYQWIKNRGLILELYNGYNTKKLRFNTFGGDPKISDKESRSFEAHCIDSFVLGCNKEFLVNEETGEVLLDEPVATNDLYVRKSVIFIQKIIKIRRCLFRTRVLYTSKSNPFGGSYYRYQRGGVKIPFECKSNKDNKPRIKPEGVHSNHPKEWIYLDNERSIRQKSNTARYGGTTYKVNKNWDQLINETTNRTIFNN